MPQPKASSTSILEAVFHHVALPPRLPHEADLRLDMTQKDLAQLLLKASITLRDGSLAKFGKQWDAVRRAIQTCKTLNVDAKLTKESLLLALRELTGSDILILHIPEQNAALLIRLSKEVNDNDSIIFEAFEASPLSEKVLESNSALQWDFPGIAVIIPCSTFADSFKVELATFLSQASTESVKRFAAHTVRGDSSVIETRDTTDPALVTGMLMTLLEANGRRCFPPLLRKRLHDDVSWGDSAKIPWRRSAFWLVVRVGLQRQLCQILGAELGRLMYKFLIAQVHCELLQDCTNHLPDLEQLEFLKTKLCRRLAKLEGDKEDASSGVQGIYEYMFTNFRKGFNTAISAANYRINNAWEDFKIQNLRPVRPLPSRADPRHLCLTLPNSSRYLHKVLTAARWPECSILPLSVEEKPRSQVLSSIVKQRGQKFIQKYVQLSEIELDIAKRNHENSPTKIREQIIHYLELVGNCYESNPEQKSLMLLTIMELWSRMDKCAVEHFPLLAEYNPGFPVDILDVLLLPQLQDMHRLAEVRSYLIRRHTQCKDSKMSIFTYPVKGCFAEQSFEKSQGLQEMYRLIDEAGKESKKQKELEWRKMSLQYEDLTRKMSQLTCIEEINDLGEIFHRHFRCPRCQTSSERDKIRIEIHEDPLPRDKVHAKVVVFELACPDDLAAYRDATWRVISALAFSQPPSPIYKLHLVSEFRTLRGFTSVEPSQFCLASTRKSNHDAHYRTVDFPVTLEQICYESPIHAAYCDAHSKVWVGWQKPTFEHHCRPTISDDSPLSNIHNLPEFHADSQGPSSYSIIASQTEAPPGVNVHEFIASQTLFSGKSRRWHQILVELGAANINFSKESTAQMINYLALQVGPVGRGEGDHLGTIHSVFKEDTFCRKLLNQLSLRLDGIAANWREINAMEVIITLSLRLTVLNTSLAEEAIIFLEKVRAITHEWLLALTTAIQCAKEVENSKSLSKTAFCVALLCRRTFAVYIDTSYQIDSTALQYFIGSSITMQDNIVSNPAALKPGVKQALIRDIKMVHRLRYILRKALEDSPSSLASAITTVWPDLEGQHSRKFSQFKFLHSPNKWWIEIVTAATSESAPQKIHFHLLEGHLLVEYKPLGQLPAEYKSSVMVEQLFGNQTLLTYPSNLPGMAYTLALNMYNHQVHLGFEGKDMIIKAVYRGTILQFIPSEKFYQGAIFDLPGALVFDCIHWIDLKSGTVDVRKKPQIWKPKPSNWTLDFYNRRAYRRTVSLVDPNSDLFRRVSKMFQFFEYPHWLTVFQPEIRPLTVELQRMELSFSVNRRSLLESRQLRSEIDPDQDAKTWYGLKSAIVLRETGLTVDFCHYRYRSVIVPLGPTVTKRDGIHVRVCAENHGDYGRFIINEVLGRIECAPEPRLLYLKAQYHAYTSFVVPDRLTGRTGREECLSLLRSGCYQPWAPLNPISCEILLEIAKLTPERNYYPRGLKAMQRTVWRQELTTTMQSDEMMPAILAIFETSKQLSIFHPQSSEPLPIDHSVDSSLQQRSILRRRLFQCPDDCIKRPSSCDMVYDSRDRRQESQARKNVEVSVKLVSSWPSVMPTTTDLAGILQNWIKITGYTGKSDRILLTDLLTLNFAEEWGPLVELCLSFDTSDVYRLMFLVALISFRQDVNMDIVRTMISFAVLEDLKALAPPKWLTYDAFRYHQIPTASYFQGLMKHALIPFNKDDELLCRLGLTPKQRRRYHGIEDAFESQQQEDSLALASFLFQQWPCQTPKTDGFSRPVLIDVPKALDIIQPDWLRLFQNLELSNYIFLVQRVLDEHRSSGDNDGESHPSKVLVQEILPTRSRVRDILSLPRLLRNSQPIAHDYTQNHLNMKVAQQHVTMPSPMLENKASIRHELCEPTGSTLSRSNEKEELQKIISELIISESTVRQQYGKDLMHSLDALKAQQSLDRIPAFFEPPQLALQITHAQQSILQQFSAICESLHRDDSRKHWLAIGGLWPRVTPITLLERLRSSVAASEFGVGMKNQLIDYAFSITQFQRLLRIEGARQKGNKQRVNEVTNVGHINWDHKSLTDWLLFEIECDIIIRSNQVDVAMATISPASMQNSVVQLNMGEGKTSCIIPMASLVLADKKRLVRVIIPKPLLLQTGQLLHSRLGGLLGREIRHVPYSRRTCGNSDTTKAFRRLHKDIQNSSGVILALPEHILSFRLSGLQKLLDGKIPEAQSLIEAQKYFDDNSRDILDEVDYILAVRTQLIYPSGSQKMVDGHPHRWELIELVLKQVDIHLWNLQRTYPRSIEVVRRAQGGFPLVFFLRKDVEDELISRLVDDIYRGRMSIIPEDSPKSDRLAIQQFIFEAKVTPQLAERITQISSGQQALRKKLLLLRGIFVHRILIMALARRWNVQYGLDARRAANVAVPYHSKSTPSDQAEFGHPDTAIILTILATYYEGLNVNQLFSTLEHVGRSDDPIQIYDSFCQASRTPDSLRDWNRINIGDKLQLNEIWNCLRYQITVVNYYMNNFVFPQHAKNFQLKIQGSGWDIPGRSPSAKSTGFSGTRLKSMLPLTTKQHDLPSLAHTDAEVLTYLLGLRNRRYVRAADPLGRRLSEYELLQMISKMGIRVFIDSGSQILEMSNENLAKSWLEIYHEAPAVLYFRGNSPYILYRNGHQLPLLASPFADDLTDVLVYLDQSHTRGTDLKLPQAAVGAISIGLGQSKDDTTQAAMRLRKLGTSQSVVFLAQPEVHQSILDFRNKTHGDPIDSCDVVHWLLEQTCIGIEKLQPLYYAQGADFCRRTQAALDNPAFLTNPDAREKYLEGIRQSESQTLDQLYGIRTKLKGLDYSGSFLLDLAQHMRDLKTLRNNYQDTSNAVHGSCLQEIEQEREREVAHEVENVRVVQKPVTYLPFPYPGLHRDIELFFKTGRLAADSAAFGHVLSAFRGTNLGRRYGINVFGSTSKLYISAQFTKTVRFPIDASDNFQRCINWLIWSPTTETAMIIIPEEAEGLLRLLREMESSKSHLLTYAAPITRKMLHFNDLTYYSTPALPQNWLPPLWLKVELGIFAGRLYFDHDEYKYLCSYVGVKEHATRLEENEDIASSSGGNNGTPDESERDTGIAEQNQPKIFTRKPLTFIGEWLALKRRGQDYAHTPMGYFCQGKLLTSDHFFFQKQDETPQNTTLRLGPIGTGVNHGREEAEDDGVEAEPFDEDLYGVGGTINEDDKFDDNELYDDTDEEND